MRKVKIYKGLHYYEYLITGWFITSYNKVVIDSSNILIVVKYEKEHLPLKYR